MKALQFAFFFCAVFSSAGSFSQTDSLKQIPEVQIQATRVRSGSAVPHNNLTAEQIKAAAETRDMPYVLSSLPSVVETSDAGAGVGYTGLRIRGSDASRINITLNGIPFNDAESQGVFWVNMPDIASSAANIQVQRGVGASTNGAGAFGASVHIDLNQITQNPSVRAHLGGGSFGTQKASFVLHSGLTKRGWYGSARWSGIHSDGFIDRASADLRGVHLQAGKIGSRFSLNGHLIHGNERTYQAWYGLPKQYSTLDAFYRFNPGGNEKPDSPHENEVDQYTQTHGLLHYKYQISNALTLQLNGHYTRGLGYFEQYKAAQTLDDYGISGLDSITESDLVRRLWLDNHFFGGTWLLRFKAFEYGGGLHQYLGNHFGRVIQVVSVSNFKEAEYYRNDAQKTDFNQFFRFEHSFGAKTKLNYDVQHRFVSYRFVGQDRNNVVLNDLAKLHFLNPKLGLTYQATEGRQYYLFSGIGHREPNRDDFTNSSPQSRPRAERLYNLESGVRLKRKTVSTTANAFLMYYKNQLVLNGRINDVGAYTRVNVPNSYRFGIELEAAGRIYGDWSFESNLSLSKQRILNYTYFVDDWDTGLQIEEKISRAPIAFSPNVVTRHAINWNKQINQRNKLMVQLTYKFVGSHYLDNTGSDFTQIKAWHTLDGQLQYTHQMPKHNQSIRLYLQVNNILNQKYFSNGWAYRYTSTDASVLADPYSASEGGNRYHQIGLFPQALRHFYAGVVYEFGE